MHTFFMKLNSTFLRALSPFLICSLLMIPHGVQANASMLSTETFLNENATSNPRERILLLIQKEEVQKKLQEYGVTPAEAKARIASLSDREIAGLNQKIDQLPAGADAAGAIIGTALVVFLVLLVTDILCLTKVFSFTRCSQ